MSVAADSEHLALDRLFTGRGVDLTGAIISLVRDDRPSTVPQPAQPPSVPPTPHPRGPVQPPARDLLGTAVQAAGELAEIGLSISARALRNVVVRLPRP